MPRVSHCLLAFADTYVRVIETQPAELSIGRSTKSATTSSLTHQWRIWFLSRFLAAAARKEDGGPAAAGWPIYGAVVFEFPRSFLPQPPEKRRAGDGGPAAAARACAEGVCIAGASYASPEQQHSPGECGRSNFPHPLGSGGELRRNPVSSGQRTERTAFGMQKQRRCNGHSTSRAMFWSVVAGNLVLS